ncbi:uncharacterized protein SPAPADRAFT_61515 [Spathaspora passalidarum NRRL Y-27907]|uniref:U1-type domain-containing protein n=1 Tax=Spathaspora passalidarum (strain NRRL Y-27907 / 11-Y1) TaxID=619300 RepID=G3AN33_SPAPN|nr:uncharacterized protein SPAPADRAFT_61515 [Spathaspora passalidarum NRRL Y-27907]EGW32447.1 hypothetical protein SPAPADRAFT_61515 [Spathaspora passalidarum NRRL Y-27907]
MDYSGRVNSKKGAGAIASSEEENVHRKKRIQELLATHILDLDNDPYVFRNHLGFLECKLCLTTHVSESSYISHLGGQKHRLNLERRRILDEKQNKTQVSQVGDIVSISNIEKRKWKKIGKPEFKVTKIRHPETLQLGLLVNIKYPKITVTEPFFRIMSYYELTSKNQVMSSEFIRKLDEDEDPDEAAESCQYLVVSGEPYENIAIAIPDKEIDKPNDGMNEKYWWFWDNDIKEFYLQFMYKTET